jgi:pimeloyl-ACP methyl ester carboxylesterase
MIQVKKTKSGIGYQILGRGEPLVILRGLGRNIRHWLGYEEVLAQIFQVIAIDLRGVGITSKLMRPSATMWDLASDVDEVLEDARVEKAHILGVSLGGMVTLAFGIKYPKRTNSLIVINTSIGGVRTLRIYPKAAALLGGKGIKADPDIELGLAPLLAGSLLSRDQVNELGQKNKQIFLTDRNVVKVVLSQILAASRFRPKKQLQNLTVPTLVIYGTDDRFVPNINSIKLASLIPHSRVIPLQGAGHEVSFDRGDQLVEILGEWIAQKQPLKVELN